MKTQNYKIYVSKKNIKDGVVDSDKNNPICLAINKALKTKDPEPGAYLGRLAIFIGMSEYAMPPKKVGVFVDRFNNCYKVRPFSFILKLRQFDQPVSFK